MQIVKNFDPSAKTTDTFNLVLPGNRGKALIYNESNISLQLTFANGYTTYVPAWTAMLYCIKDLTSPLVTWKQYATLTSSGSPISQVVVEIYEQNEPVPGTYPAALVRQTNIGNTVTASVGSITTLTNDGNTSGTQIIESTPTGAGSSTISIDNAGNTTIKGNNAGTLTTLLQLIAGASPAVKLAAAAVLTEALGNLKVDGTLESVGAATLDSTLTVTGATTLNGAASLTAAGTGLAVTNNETVGGTLTVTGATTLNGAATLGAAGTGLSVTNNETVGGTLSVTGSSSLDNGNITSDGSGNLTVSGGLILPNNIRYQTKDTTGTVHTLLYEDTSNNVNLRAGSNNTIQLQNGSAALLATVNNSGITLNTGTFTFIVGTLSRFTIFNGTGNQTIGTGLGTTPTTVFGNPCTVSGSSQTIGYTNAQSSVVTTGSGLAWNGTAVKT